MQLMKHLIYNYLKDVEDNLISLNALKQTNSPIKTITFINIDPTTFEIKLPVGN